MKSWRPTVYKTETDARAATSEELRERKSELVGFCTEQVIIDRELSRRANRENNRVMVNGLNDYPHAK